MRRRRLLAGLGLAAVAAIVAVIAGALAPRAPAPAPERATAGALPAPVAPAFTPGTPRPLGSTRNLSHWAPVLRAVAARRAPDAAAAVVARVSRARPRGRATSCR
jgi:hypothetical protein